MPETDPFSYLRPNSSLDPNDPDAIARWIADNDQSQGGAVPSDVDMPSPDEGFSAPEGNAPAASPASGQWGSFLQDPANRAFMINAGIQLMSGGWGGWGEQVGRALAAGFQGAHAVERDQQGLAPVGLPRDGRGGNGQPRGRGGPLRPSARPRGRQVDPEVAQQAQAQIAQLQSVAQFLARPDLTEAEFMQQAAPGGLIHNAVGPAAQFGRKNEYLVQVQQSIQRLHQLPRRGGAVSTQELLTLGQSESPAAQTEFQILARQILGNPGVGYRWSYNRETGQIDRAPLTGGGRGGPSVRGTEHSRNATAAMQAGLGALDDVSEALANTTGLDRFASNITGLGTWSTVRPQLNIISRALMHGLSGANVTLPETSAYLEAFMPNPNRPADWSLERVEFRLNHARSLLVAMLSRGENQISEDVRFGIVNSMRKYLGLPELTMQEHLLRLQRYGIPPGPMGDVTSTPPAAQQPPPGGPPPGTTLGPAQPQTPPTAPPAAPQFEQGPDGTWRLKR